MITTQPLTLEVQPCELFPEWHEVIRAEHRIAVIKVLDEGSERWFSVLSGYLTEHESRAVQKSLQFTRILGGYKAP